MKLVELYKSILSTAHLVCTDDGYISSVLTGEPEPALIKGKRLVLPTPEHLATSDWSQRIVFHPLSENVLRGKSNVLEYFRGALNVRLNYTLGLLMYQLLIIATSTELHKKLSPEQSEFLSKVKNADEKTLEVLQKLMKAMPHNQFQKAFVNLYLIKPATINGKQYARGGIVNFPLYEELIKSTTECYGVKMRKMDRETLIALMEYMIPEIETPKAHNRGSNSDVAPFMDALMKSLLPVASAINDIVELFSNQIDDSEKLLFEDKWVETFENLAVMVPEIRLVPMQAGNEGATKQEEIAQAIPQPAPYKPAAVAPVISPWVQPAPPQYFVPIQSQQPQQRQQPQKAAAPKGGIDFNTWASGGNVNQQPQQPQGWQQPQSSFQLQQPQGWGQQQPQGWNNQQQNTGWSNQPQQNNNWSNQQPQNTGWGNQGSGNGRF